MKHILWIHLCLDLLQFLQVRPPVLVRTIVSQRTVYVSCVSPEVVAQSIRDNLVQPCEEITNFVVHVAEEVNGVCLVVEECVAMTVGCGIGGDVVDCAALEVPDEEPCEGAFVRFVDVLEEFINRGVGD